MSKRKRVENLFRWINVLLILATFLAYLSPFIHPGKFWIPSFFGLAYPWLLLFNIGFIIFWLSFKKKYFLFSLVTIILGWNHFDNFVGLRLFTKTYRKEHTTIMSFNLRALRSLNIKNKEKAKEKKNAFLKFIQQKGQIDLLCTQECTTSNQSFLTTALNFDHVFRPTRGHVVIFSKYPMLNSGQLIFEKSSNSCTWVDIKIKGEKIRVYNLHLQSTKISPIANKVIKEGDLQEKETWLNIKGILGRVKRASQQRAAQALKIAKHIKKCPYPIILCGDFNDTPQSFTYRVLSKGLKDSFQQKGRGLGTSFAGSIPALRIDYILLNPKFNVRDCSILKENYSDHFPVISQIQI